MRTRIAAVATLVGLMLGMGTVSAHAERSLLTRSVVDAEKVPGGQIEGACGVAVADRIYVSDYYHHAVDVFGSGGAYISQIAGDPADGPCQLATGPGGVLYANDWHEGAERLLPTRLSFDSAESTGVAVDASGNVYVDDRTYVAVYEASGAPVLDGEGHPLRIGLGNLGDAYGLAVDGGRVYVPDAAAGVVKVFEPAVDTLDPVLTIDGSATPQGGFVSLVDAAVAVDPGSGHLLVLDNLQPGYEAPEAAIDEFDAASGVFLGQVSQRVVDGGPSGMAVADAHLYVTNGNSEGSEVLEFGPYVAGLAPAAASARGVTGTSSPPAPFPASPPPAAMSRAGSGSQADIVQKGGIRVRFDGGISPRALPRSGSRPVRVAVDAKIAAADGGAPSQLQRIKLEINRYGHLEPQGLPLCTVQDIQPSTTQRAMEACGPSLIGKGAFAAKVVLGRQAPFPASGPLYAFNGTFHGRPAILAHVYGTDPVPTSFTLPFLIRPAGGTFGTALVASLPEATGGTGYVTHLALALGRRFRSHGRLRSYLTASCPAPAGFGIATFPFARATMSFRQGPVIASTITRSCKVRG